MGGGRERERERERQRERKKETEKERELHQYSLLKEALNSVKEATSSESTKTS